MCGYFGKCGGCSLQHADYGTQLKNKRGALAKAVMREDIQVFSGEPYGYRNRMDMVFHESGIGFREKGTWWKPLPIERCEISNGKLNELVGELNSFFAVVDAFDLKKHTGTFRYAVIRTPSEDSSISFVLNSGSQRIAQAIERIKEFAGKTAAKNVIVTYAAPETDVSVSDEYFVVKGSDMISERLMGNLFKYSVQGFFQNNHEMAERMHEYVNSRLKTHDCKGAHLLDLYGGVGTFGINNASLFRGVTIVESVPPCIEAAKINMEINGVKNGEAMLLDATHLKKLDLPRPLFVVTDPPRTGMHPKTIEQLNALSPKAIIYISCNIEQLGKDIPKFKGYKLKSAAMFDLFPQTPHIEAVAELVRD